MTTYADTCWPYFAESREAHAESVPVTSVPFPMSPRSVSSTAVPSPSTAEVPSFSASPKPSSLTQGRKRRQNPRTTRYSSLPDPKELSVEDDWTRVKCPKEKKKIQNRVAQRTYRHRMKARLGELQARLDSHEEKRKQQAMLGSGNILHHHNSIPRSLRAHMVGSQDAAGIHALSGKERSLESEAHFRNRSSSPFMLNPTRPTMPMLEHGVGDHSTEESEAAFFPNNTPYLQSPPNSLPSPTAADALLSPLGRSELVESGNTCPNLVPDCLYFQPQLFNRLSVLELDEGCTNKSSSQYSTVDELTQILGPDRSHVMRSHTSAPVDSLLDFQLDESRGDWRSDATDFGSGNAQSSLSPAKVPSLQEHSIRPMGGMMSTSVPGVATEMANPASFQSRRIDERVESIMGHIHAAGFGSFDAAATAYYTAALRDTSPLATEQHVSRSKRLPETISHVFRAADSWPHWERRGFHQEIMQAAREIVAAEASASQDSIVSECTSLLQAHENGDVSKVLESVGVIRDTIKQMCPTAFRLRTPLAAASGSESLDWQSDGSANAALAGTVLDKLSGKMRKDQLLQILEALL